MQRLVPLYEENSWRKNFSKSKSQDQNSRHQHGDTKQVHTEAPQILGTTGLNLVARVTWHPKYFRLWTKGWRGRGLWFRHLAGAIRFLLLSSFQTGLGAYTNFYSKGTVWSLSPRLHSPVRETAHWLPFSTEVKNAWSLISISPNICTFYTEQLPSWHKQRVET